MAYLNYKSSIEKTYNRIKKEVTNTFASVPDVPDAIETLIKSAKSDGKSLADVLLQATTSDTSDKAVMEWLSHAQNQDTFARAWSVIEPDPTYTVVLPNGQGLIDVTADDATKTLPTLRFVDDAVNTQPLYAATKDELKALGLDSLIKTGLAKEVSITVTERTNHSAEETADDALT